MIFVYICSCLFTYFSLHLQEEENAPDMPVTHDSMRLIEQAKTICEQRIYLDEAKELYSLISSKWLHVSNCSIIHSRLKTEKSAIFI